MNARARNMVLCKMSGTRALSKKLFPMVVSGEIDEYLCRPPTGSKLAQPLHNSDPYTCQLPLSMVNPACRRYCSQQLDDPPPCSVDCRRWITVSAADGQFAGFVVLEKFALNAIKNVLKVSLLVPRTHVLDREIRTRWIEGETVESEDMFNSWRYFTPSAGPLTIAISGFTFDPQDARMYSTMRAFVGKAKYGFRETTAKDVVLFGELRCYLDLNQPSAISVRIPVALSDKQHPSSEREVEYQKAGLDASFRTPDPSTEPWPDIPKGNTQQPTRKLQRTPLMNDLATRSQTYRRLRPHA